jgi:hypothetical protein
MVEEAAHLMAARKQEQDRERERERKRERDSERENVARVPISP